MNNILVLGIVVCERDPFGGIIDIDRDPQSANEAALFAKINEALNEPRPDYLDPSLPFIGSAGGEMELCGDGITYIDTPFTGTIEDTVILYAEW